MQTFGEKLKTAREAAQLSQSSLAELSGVPVGTIRNYEQRDRRKPDFVTAAKLAAALGADLWHLAGIIPKKL